MAELLGEFREQGFVKIERFIADETLTELQSRVATFVKQRVASLPREHVFYEDKDDPSTLKQVQGLVKHEPFFQDLVDGPLRQLAELLLEGPVQAKNLQYFNKPARVGKATPPHQDGYYFMLRPCEAITLWLALDHVDEENGCVRYLPGSHRCGMRPHARTTTLGFSQGISDFGSPEDRAREVATRARPGDLLAHHALTVHRADANSSETRSRRALGAVFYSQRAKQDQESHRAYQERLRSEMLADDQI